MHTVEEQTILRTVAEQTILRMVEHYALNAFAFTFSTIWLFIGVVVMAPLGPSFVLIDVPNQCKFDLPMNRDVRWRIHLKDSMFKFREKERALALFMRGAIATMFAPLEIMYGCLLVCMHACQHAWTSAMYGCTMQFALCSSLHK